MLFSVHFNSLFRRVSASDFCFPPPVGLVSNATSYLNSLSAPTYVYIVNIPFSSLLNIDLNHILFCERANLRSSLILCQLFMLLSLSITQKNISANGSKKAEPIPFVFVGSYYEQGNEPISGLSAFRSPGSAWQGHQLCS
jgi:hypothetical protein